MNKIGRRGFVGTLSAACAGTFAVCAQERPLLKVGVLSDPHVTSDPTTAEPLLKAFECFAAEGVEAVVIAGDICHNGRFAELENVVNAWRKAFPGGKNSFGGKVEPFFIFGNHDYHDASYQRGRTVDITDKRNLILYNKEKAWRMITGEDRFPGEVFMRRICGVTFIGAHWMHQGVEVAEFLEKHRSEIPADRPVIYVQHPHPRNTCYSGWAKGDDGTNRAALMKYPNLFAISGHSHTSISFDDAVWQGGFCSMGAGALRGARGRRYEYNYVLSKAEIAAGKFKYMPPANIGKAWQTAIMSIYPLRTVVSRWDVANGGEVIGEDWCLDFPYRHDVGRPCRIAAAAPAPEFPPMSRIDFRVGKERVYPSKASANVLRMKFPCAKSTGPHSRVMDYRVEVLAADGMKKIAERLVAQEMTSFAEKRTRAYPGWCAFGLDELPTGKDLLVRVTPINAGGRCGSPLEAHYVIEPMAAIG